MTEIPKPGQLWRVKKGMEHHNLQLNKFWVIDDEGNKIRRVWSRELATVGWEYASGFHEPLPAPVPGDILFVTDVIWNQVPLYAKQTLEEAKRIYWVTCIVGEEFAIVGCASNGWEYHLEKVS